MRASDINSLPWPALLVSRQGSVLAASPAAVALIGSAPGRIAEIENRFELLSGDGEPVAPDLRPQRRASRAELFEVVGVWRDRNTGREVPVRFRGRAVGAHGLLEIDSLPEEAERRAEARLSKLKARPCPRTGPVSRLRGCGIRS